MPSGLVVRDGERRGGNAALPAAGAEAVDRTIAVVNGHLVTWSDLDEQMRFEALENKRPLKELTAADRHTAFEHLVQDWILRDQMQGTLPATESDVDTRIAAIREIWGLVPHMDDDNAKWAATLERYGLSPQELRELVANQLEILRFLEFRVRPLVGVSRQEVDDYYTDTLAPQVRARGETPEPEDQVSSNDSPTAGRAEDGPGDAEVDRYPAFAEPGADSVGRGAVRASRHLPKGQIWGQMYGSAMSEEPEQDKSGQEQGSKDALPKAAPGAPPIGTGTRCC